MDKDYKRYYFWIFLCAWLWNRHSTNVLFQCLSKTVSWINYASVIKTSYWLLVPSLSRLYTGMDDALHNLSWNPKHIWNSLSLLLEEFVFSFVCSLDHNRHLISFVYKSYIIINLRLEPLFCLWGSIFSDLENKKLSTVIPPYCTQIFSCPWLFCSTTNWMTISWQYTREVLLSSCISNFLLFVFIVVFVVRLTQIWQL